VVSIRADKDVVDQFRWLTKFTGQPQGIVLNELLRHGGAWTALIDMLHRNQLDDDIEARQVARELVKAQVRLTESFYMLARQYPKLALAASPDGRPPEPMTPEMAAAIMRIVGEAKPPVVEQGEVESEADRSQAPAENSEVS